MIELTLDQIQAIPPNLKWLQTLLLRDSRCHETPQGTLYRFNPYRPLPALETIPGLPRHNSEDALADILYDLLRDREKTKAITPLETIEGLEKSGHPWALELAKTLREIFGFN